MKPETQPAARSSAHRIVRWPRGRYNGWRIAGVQMTLDFNLSMVSWKPWCYGFRWLHHWPKTVRWLGVRVSIEPEYHFDDEYNNRPANKVNP